MIPQLPANSVTADPRGLLCVDEEPTADLPFESTQDLTSTFEAGVEVSAESVAAESATSLHDTAVATDASIRLARDPGDVSRLAPMPKGRGSGFFVFAVCAVIATVAALEEPGESPSVTPDDASQVVRLTPETRLAGAEVKAVSIPTPMVATSTSAADYSGQGLEPKRADNADAAIGRVAFQSRSFVTSEQSTAAVVILNRTQVNSGRARVRWSTRTGSADAGIDYSDVSGIASFADGQRQVAIYIPLRNDLIKEHDETFQVCLSAPRQVRIAGRSCAEVIILDDDELGPT